MLYRRTLLKSLAGLPLAAVLADPKLARAAAETTRSMTINTAGGQSVTAAVAEPQAAQAPAVVLVHEWWGLNDQIKTMARAFADAGFLAVAVDLFGGRVVTTPEQARELTQTVVPEQASDTMAAWINWAGNNDKSTRKTATAGWCFGGGWALRGAVAAPVDATVVYYGRVDLPPDQLARLKGPVLGHFARTDKFITPEVVQAFETNMKQAGKSYQLHWYEADHAFANPTGANYDREDAQLAWNRTLAFLKERLA